MIWLDPLDFGLELLMESVHFAIGPTRRGNLFQGSTATKV